MNHNDIKIFLTIAETGSLNQAANVLFVSQPALSQQLKNLETELETTLFNRKKGQRTISLTTSGKAFLKIAQKFDLLWKESMQLKSLEEIPSLSINAVGSLNAYLLPPLYLSLASMRPPLSLTIATNKTRTIYQSIANRDFDLGFVNRNFNIKEVSVLPLFCERMYFICDKDSSYPDLLISPADLNPAREIYLSWSTEYKEWHEYWFDTSIRPHILMDRPSLLERFIIGTECWAIVPASVLSTFQNTERIRSVRLTDPPPDRFCYALAHADRKELQDSPAALCMEQLYALLDKNPWLEKLYPGASDSQIPAITTLSSAPFS